MDVSITFGHIEDPSSGQPEMTWSRKSKM